MASCKDCKHYSMCGFSKYAKAEKCLDFIDVSNYVRVVRCKDCKHYHADTVSCDFTPHGKYYERPNWYEDDFCSFGERKDND